MMVDGIRYDAFNSVTFKNGIDYVNAHYGVTLQYEQMQCGFTDFNEQCIKERCPFYE